MKSKLLAPIIAILLTAVVGWMIPVYLITDGTSRLRNDPGKRAAAESSIDAAWRLNDNPIQRIIYLKPRVVDLWHEEHDCPLTVAAPSKEHRNLKVRVRFYSWFGIPGPAVIVDCGGAGSYRWDNDA